MLTNNDNCGTPVNNLVYESESCFYSQGRDIKNILGLGTTGYSLVRGKFNDMVGLYNINNGDPSLAFTLDPVNRVIDMVVPISADPGNTITVQPDGLYGAPTTDSLNPLLLMGG
jgi:hypothetical protein